MFSRQLIVRSLIILATMMFCLLPASGTLISSRGGEAPLEAQKPVDLPIIPLYSADSPFNQAIDSQAEIDQNSPEYVEGIEMASPFLISVRQYSTPVYFADENTPRYEVRLPCGSAWGLKVQSLQNVPIPDWAEPAFDKDGADNPPSGCGEDSSQDNIMVVVDRSTGCEYDFWQMRKKRKGWVASWGNSISLATDGIFPEGLSARGSGFAWLGGIIWPNELRTGRIDHALVFSYPFTKAGGPVPPATESDGNSNRVFALPEGALVQLDPSLDLDTLPLLPYERTIAEALQNYGMYLVDNGGNSGISLYAVDPKSAQGNIYDGLLPDDDYPLLPDIPLSSFRVLKLLPQVADWEDRISLPEVGCAQFSFKGKKNR